MDTCSPSHARRVAGITTASDSQTEFLFQHSNSKLAPAFNLETVKLSRISFYH